MEAVTKKGKKCKYCRAEIFGGHEERRLHSQNCEERSRKLNSNASEINSGTTTTSNSNISSSIRPHDSLTTTSILLSETKRTTSSSTTEATSTGPSSHRSVTSEGEIVLKGQDTCIVCGVVFFNKSHNVEECKQLKGGSLFMKGRRRTKEEVQSGIQRRKKLGLDPNPHKFSKSVTPDISAYDRKIKALVSKKLPPLRPKSPSQQWTHCVECGKRLVQAHLQEHRDNVCVVLGMTLKLTQLKHLVAEGLGKKSSRRRQRAVVAVEDEAAERGGGTVVQDFPSFSHSTTTAAEGDSQSTTTDIPAPVPVPSRSNVRGSSSPQKKEKETRPAKEGTSTTAPTTTTPTTSATTAGTTTNPPQNRLLAGLTHSDAVVEEALQLVAVLDAVVPITDLFLHRINSLTPVLDPTLADIELAIPTIGARLDIWREGIHQAATHSSSSVSQVVSSTRGVGSGQRGGSGGSRGLITHPSSLPVVPSLSKPISSSLPKLSGLLHGPRLHLRAEDEKKVIAAPGQRTKELALSKTANHMGGGACGGSRHATPADENSVTANSAASGASHHHQVGVYEDGNEYDGGGLHTKFDPQVVRLAQAIVKGQLTMSEAMYPEMHPNKQQRIYGS